MKNFRGLIASLILLAAFAFKPDTSSASGIQVINSGTGTTLHVIVNYDLYARIGSSAVFVTSGSAAQDISNGQTTNLVTGTDNVDLYKLTGLSINILGAPIALSPSQVSDLNAGRSVRLSTHGIGYTITPQIISFGGTSVFSITP